MSETEQASAALRAAIEAALALADQQEEHLVAVWLSQALDAALIGNRR